MTRNLEPGVSGIAENAALPAAVTGRSIVLIGLMGAGKTSIGRRLAARLGLPFRDADAEIELAAGCTVSELFERWGEASFRDGERRVIRRLLAGDPLVLATGGGAFMDPQTREVIRSDAISVWLRCSLATLVRRVSGRQHRPLLHDADPAEVLTRLMRARNPVYAEADIIVDCGEESLEHTRSKVQAALSRWQPPRRLAVALPGGSYDVVAGPGLLERAGALLAPILPQRRAVVVTDDTVAALHLPALLAGLAETGIEARAVSMAPGEKSKSLEVFGQVVDGLLETGVERRTAVIALGGGVVGDLAGFAAASVLRGLPFIQAPTTLLAQVDSSVGGKTGINTRWGKNLVGAFHQPRLVIADTGTLATLPLRELRSGYAEVAKAGLIGDPALWTWCERRGEAVVGGDAAAQADAVVRACAFKAAVVADDEREEAPEGGRALLNLGHTFAHAFEAELGYGGALLHGEAVGLGLALAFRLSERLGLCPGDDRRRVEAHLEAVGLATEVATLPCASRRRFSAARLVAHMRRDKKGRDGRMRFVLVRGIGEAFTTDDVPEAEVLDLLQAEGCEA